MIDKIKLFIYLLYSVAKSLKLMVQGGIGHIKKNIYYIFATLMEYVSKMSDFKQFILKSQFI